MTAAATQVKIRQAGSLDEHVILELCLAALPAEDAAELDGLRRFLWGHEEWDGWVQQRLVAELGGTVVAVAAGHHRTTEDGTAGHIGLLVVAEPHRRHGVATQLLAALERHFADAGATELWVGGSQPFFWWPGVDLAFADAIAFFAARGFETDDDVENMDVDLGAADLEVPALLDVDIHRLRRDERDDFTAWLRHAWDDDWAAEAQQVLLRSPVSCWVATLEGRYIGFAGYDTNRRGWFGPMGTTEEARGRGVGRALLRSCLRDMVERGDTECEICWIGPESFYRNAVGAEIGRKFRQFRKDVDS